MRWTPGVTTRNFDCFTINSDENLFRSFIILISALSLKTSVLLRTVHLCLLCVAHGGASSRPYSTCQQEQVPWGERGTLALSWTVCEGQGSQGPRDAAPAGSAAHLLGAPCGGGHFPLRSSEGRPSTHLTVTLKPICHVVLESLPLGQEEGHMWGWPDGPSSLVSTQRCFGSLGDLQLQQCYRGAARGHRGEGVLEPPHCFTSGPHEWSGRQRARGHRPRQTSSWRG